MAFCSYNSFQRICQIKNSLQYMLPSITAAFDTLTTLGQIPLTGIAGNFATYSVLNNGATVAIDQIDSTYTFTGLGDNVQIGPITLIPYDIDGVAGTAVTVTGGGGGSGTIYTWAQANAPTFSAITSSGTTLVCTGTFSKIYLTYSGGATGSPASGTLINTANSISTVYTGLAANTAYTFVVYPVNGDGIPGSATGTNTATAPVTTRALITAAAFDTISVLGQIPLTGIAGNFATYAVLKSGTVDASNQTASTYTITGLGNNVQIGPVTVVPYDSLGVAGTAFTVTGGSGAGKNYTWAQANAPTFSATTSSGTTLACTGTFSKIYVSYSGGAAGSPVSGTLINTANSISTVYTGLAGNTTYTFVVYPVNGGGIPASATGSNTATASVLTLPPTVWTTSGVGTVNTLAYSTNGTTWTGRGKSIFNSEGDNVAYSAFHNRWVAAGTGTVHSLAYSNDGFTWTGLGKSVISQVWCVAYSEFQKRWVAVGQGITVNNMAYSTDGITWVGNGMPIFSGAGYGVAYSASQNRWVAGGSGGNCLAYSTDGITWIGKGMSIFSSNGNRVAYGKNCWVAGGNGTVNSLAYSADGINWTGRGKSIFSNNGYCVAYSEFQNRWVAGGYGTAHTLGYSADGFNWIGSGITIFSTVGRSVAYSATQNRWVAAGQGTVNTLAYSTDGITWIGSGNSIFSNQGMGIACNN